MIFLHFSCLTGFSYFYWPQILDTNHESDASYNELPNKYVEQFKSAPSQQSTAVKCKIIHECNVAFVIVVYFADYTCTYIYIYSIFTVWCCYFYVKACISCLYVYYLYQLKAKIIVKYVLHVEITGVVFVILWSSKPKIKKKIDYVSKVFEIQENILLQVVSKQCKHV